MHRFPTLGMNPPDHAEAPSVEVLVINIHTVQMLYTLTSSTFGFSNSALPSFTVAYRIVPDASVLGTGAFVPSPIDLISSLIFRVAASSTAPGGMSAISSTFLKVRTSLIREARDWMSLVVGPSKRRNNCGVLVFAETMLYRNQSYPVAPDCSPQPCLESVI